MASGWSLDANHPELLAAGELPSGLEKVCFTWERGSKLFTTSAEAVNPHTRAVFWQQFLRQVGMSSSITCGRAGGTLTGFTL